MMQQLIIHKLLLNYNCAVLYNLQVLYSPLFWHTAEKLEPEKVYLHIGMRLQSLPLLPPVTKLSHIEVRKTWQVATVLGKYTPVVEIPTVAEVRIL